MLTRNRRKSGRGYSREEWINHHKKIVERSEKAAHLVRVEAEKKIPKIMVENAKITDQERGAGEYLTQPGRTINVGAMNELEEQKRGIVGNVWADIASKSDENRKATDKTIDSSTTQHTGFSREMSTAAGVDEKQHDHSTTLTKEVHLEDSGMDIEETAVQESYPTDTLVQIVDAKQGQSLTEVRIKQEMIDEAVNEHALL